MLIRKYQPLLILFIVVIFFGIIGFVLFTSSRSPKEEAAKETEEAGTVEEVQNPFESYPVEKEIMMPIEGMEEKVLLSRYIAPGSSFIMYVDESRYEVSDENGSTLIKPLPLETEGDIRPVPEVSLRIEPQFGVPPEALLEREKASWKEETGSLPESESAETPVQGERLHMSEGSEWDSPVITEYIVPDGKGSSLLITETLFLEAQEGHGARFDAMLKTFETGK